MAGTLYYAMGGGLGHLVRARAVLHTLGLEDDATLLTASAHALDPRVVGRIPVHLVPKDRQNDPQAYRVWLAEMLIGLKPSAIFVDTFPFGLLGELCDPPIRAVLMSTRVFYVGRLLRWNTYLRACAPAGPWPKFERAHLVESLYPDHEKSLRSMAEEVSVLHLRDPPPVEDQRLAELPPRFWLVAHSGATEETSELIAFARDLQRLEANSDPLVVTSPFTNITPLSGALPVDFHPATPLFDRANRVISACGYNIMRQMAIRRHLHRFMPFARRYDDQVARAATCRTLINS